MDRLLDKLCDGKPSEQVKAFVEHYCKIAHKIGGDPQPAMIALAVAFASPVFSKQIPVAEVATPVAEPKPETVTAKKGAFKRGS